MHRRQRNSWKCALVLCLNALIPGHLAAENARHVLLTNIGVWDSAASGIRDGINILIADGSIAHAGSEVPTSPSGTRAIDGSGHFVVGSIIPGQKANFVVLDASPAEDIAIIADTASHVRLAFSSGLMLKDDLGDTRDVTIEEDAFHVPLRTVIAARDWGSIGFGGIVMIDSLSIRQDEEGRQQVGEISNTGAGVSGARFGFFGHLGRKFKVTYYTDIGYNGFEEGFDIQNNDEYSLYNLEFGFPETPIGTFTVGRMKPPGTISRLWAGAYMPLASRQAPVAALTKSRDDGVKLSNTAFNKRMTWSVGISNDWLSEDADSMSDASSYVSARVTGQLLRDNIDDRLLHVGVTARWSDFASESIRFSASPGIPFVPKFLDTGEMPGDAARWLTGEFAFRQDRLMVSGEYLRSDIDSPTIGSPTFTGSYLWAEYTLTGETRQYNADKAVFTRPLPVHDFGKGGKGLWSIALAINDTDLNDGSIDGGDMQQVTFGINWYPQKSFRWGLGLSRIWLDRLGVESQTDYAHLFLHVSNL